MFNAGTYGVVTVDNASNALAIKRVQSPLVDISAGTCQGVAVFPLLAARDKSIGILSINLIYQASAGGAAGAIDFGTAGDTNSVGSALATSITATVGTQTNFTAADFASTVKKNIHKAGGNPVLTPGDVLLMTITAGAGNAGDFVVEVEYFDTEPGT